MQPLLYQDDVVRLAPSLESLQYGNDRIVAVAESKLLDFHTDKSCFTVFGKKKDRERIIAEHQSNPVQLCGQNMKHEETVKYLGDMLSGKGLAESVSETVKSRKNLVLKSVFEIRSVVDDCRSVVAGGLDAGLMIWEMAVIPTLLNNAECWMEASSATVEDLEQIQIKFLKNLLAVGSGCPTPLLFSETGSILMELRILEKKLLFLHHLESLPAEALAHEILMVQKNLNLPGLAKECQPFLQRFKVNKVSDYSKYQWKRLVKLNILNMNKELIIERTAKQNYKKIDIDKLRDDDFVKKSYFKTMNLYDARMRFKFASKMLPTVRMNFQSDSKFMAEGWKCLGCADAGDTNGS